MKSPRVTQVLSTEELFREISMRSTDLHPESQLALAKDIEHWPLDRLIPNARNARTHSDAQIAHIAASIREFGFTNPILVDSNDGIIAGHGRLLAARKLKLTQIPVITPKS
jgi:hypothetical protein